MRGLFWGVAILCLVAGPACDGGGDDPAGSIEAAAEDLATAVEDTVETVGDGAADVVGRTIDEIRTAIEGKEDELDELKKKLASMSPNELTGDAAGELKKKSEALMKEIEGLRLKLDEAVSD